MIGIDTNLLARLVLQDHKHQSILAEDTIADTEGGKNFISIIVICELIWLLDSRYGYSRRHLADIIEMLISSDDFVVEDRDVVAQALTLYVEKHADFADILIGLRNRKAGCDTTITFDKHAAKLDMFILLA